MSWRKTGVLSKLPHFAAIALTALQLSAVAEAQVLPGRDAAVRGSVKPNRIAALIQAQDGTLSTETSASFVAHRDFVAADVAERSAQADLNGDGITDLVVTNGNLNGTNISVLLGKRRWHFPAGSFL